MDKMIQKLVQKTLSRYNEAHKALREFDYDSIPVELRTEERSAARYGDDALLKLCKMEEDGTLEENKALVAKHLRDLEHYIIAVENIQIAFELGTMSEEEIKAEAEKIGEGQKEIFERMWCVDSVEDVNLRIYLREINHERVTQIIWPLNSLVKTASSIEQNEQSDDYVSELSSQSSWQTKFSKRRAVWGTRSPIHRHNFKQSTTMKQLLDTFGRWGFTGLLVALLAISGFLIFFDLVGAPLFFQVLQKIVGVIGVYLAIFIGKQACFADLFPTSVTRFFAYMREHANTEDE